MGYEAFAHWFNIEMPLQASFVERIKTALNQHIKTCYSETSFIGREYSLFLKNDEVIVKANALFDIQEEIFEQDLYFYQDENIACCGLEDFCHLFQNYIEFIQRK